MQIPKTSFILQWSRSVRLSEGENGFSATVRVPWGEKVLYRFFVDDKWAIIDDVPIEVDQEGYVNNIYYTPAKPQDVDAPRYESPAVQQPMTSPIPASAPKEDDLVIVPEPKISIIPTCFPASKASPDLVTVERRPSSMMSPIPASVSKEDDLVIVPKPRISLIPTCFPASKASPDLVTVERRPSPMISLTRAPVSLEEEEDPSAAKSSLVEEQG